MARLSLPSLSRRRLLSGSGAALAAGLVTPAAAHAAPRAPLPSNDDTLAWRDFIARFATPDGRIVDTGNAGMSHTEGQGIGLLATAMFGDEEVFQRLFDWTERTLRHRSDSLHAWQFLPNANVQTPDGNPATDGELLIAHALFLAGRRWTRPDLTAAAQAIARDVASSLVGEAQGRQVLLPGLRSEQQPGHVVLNPSYYLFPTLRHIAAETGDAGWQTLHDDGLVVLRQARFGRWRLPADWISLPRSTDGCMIAPGRPARFSYDAIRLPLYLAWAGIGDHPALSSALAFWSEAPGAAAWADLRSNAVAPYALTPGMRAIRDYVRARVGLASSMTIPPIRLAPTYYDAALTMLVRVALATPGETGGNSVLL